MYALAINKDRDGTPESSALGTVCLSPARVDQIAPLTLGVEGQQVIETKEKPHLLVLVSDL